MVNLGKCSNIHIRGVALRNRREESVEVVAQLSDLSAKLVLRAFGY